MRAVVAREGLHDHVTIDSAGTAGWHTGKGADRRSVLAAAARGITITGGARQVTAADFTAFDLLLAADQQNVADLRAIAPNGEAAGKIVLLRAFDPDAVAAGTLAVPDPYYGGADGFDHVLDVVQAACEGLVTQLRDTGAVP